LLRARAGFFSPSDKPDPRTSRSLLSELLVDGFQHPSNYDRDYSSAVRKGQEALLRPASCTLSACQKAALRD